MRVHLFASLAACLVLTGCAAPSDAPPTIGARAASASDQCFNAATVRRFRAVGREAVDVEVSRNRVFRLELGAGCLDVNWAQRVALRPRSGSFVCSPGQAELIVPSRIGPNRCFVSSVRRLSEAEAEASRRRR